MKPATRRQVAAIIFGVVFGLGLGVGGYTFLYAKGWSYLTNDPSACANCHIMREHYDAWIKSSHRAVAMCNDCHTPHNFFGKYYVKADHGFWYSYAFTTGNFHKPIQMKERSQQVTEGARHPVYCSQRAPTEAQFSCGFKPGFAVKPAGRVSGERAWGNELRRFV